MATNSFCCPQCGKFTRHIDISLREFGALSESAGFLGRCAVSITELIGANKVASEIGGWKCWKCCDCGFATTRELNGEIDDTATEPIFPFKIKDVLIGNIDYNGNIITDYGYGIYSSKTQYLIPKLTIETDIEGTYDIYVKAYRNGKIRRGDKSPSKYSYSERVSLKKGKNEYTLLGWGSSEPGNWDAGEAKFEFYFCGLIVFTKEIFVY